MRTTQQESGHGTANAAARQGRGQPFPKVRRKGRPSQTIALPATEEAAMAAATQCHELHAEIADRDVVEHEAWQQRRHDLDMRLAVLTDELDRALAKLHLLLERYDELQLERAQAEPPIRGNNFVQPHLLTLVSLTRERIRLQTEMNQARSR